MQQKPRLCMGMREMGGRWAADGRETGGEGQNTKQLVHYAPSKAACRLRFRLCVVAADAAAADAAAAAAVVAAAAAVAVADVDVAVAPPARTLAALDGGPPADDGALVTLIVIVSQWSWPACLSRPPELRRALCKPELWVPADLRIRLVYRAPRQAKEARPVVAWDRRADDGQTTDGRRTDDGQQCLRASRPARQHGPAGDAVLLAGWLGPAWLLTRVSGRWTTT